MALPSSRATPYAIHAPLSDPGGVLDARPVAPRTAAFRPLETVGFPLDTVLRISCCPRLYTFRGSITRPASSFPPAPYSHCWACTWSSLPTCWLGFGQVGLEPIGSHPLGNNNQFHGNFRNPKVLGLPWRDQCDVRLEFRV